MIILNNENEDFHTHSITYSDGMNSIDEMVAFAGNIGMTKLVITDHSQAALDIARLQRKTFRSLTRTWENVLNNVQVHFGIEADLLNEHGDICDHIENQRSNFTILSYHPHVYSGDKNLVVDGFVKAIEKNADRINLLGHIFAFTKDYDMSRVVDCANANGVALELNCKNLIAKNDFSQANLDYMINNAERLYVNSDAHTLAELKNSRKVGFDYLRSLGKI